MAGPPPFPTSFRCLFRGEFVGSSLFMGGTSSHTGNLPFSLLIHTGKTSAAMLTSIFVNLIIILSILILCKSHKSSRVNA